MLGRTVCVHGRNVGVHGRKVVSGQLEFHQNITFPLLRSIYAYYSTKTLQGPRGKVWVRSIFYLSHVRFCDEGVVQRREGRGVAAVKEAPPWRCGLLFLFLLLLPSFWSNSFPLSLSAEQGGKRTAFCFTKSQYTFSFQISHYSQTHTLLFYVIYLAVGSMNFSYWVVVF